MASPGTTATEADIIAAAAPAMAGPRMPARAWKRALDRGGGGPSGVPRCSVERIT
jgi:hypothetical protein